MEPKRTNRGGPRPGFGGAQPGAGRKPDKEPTRPRAIRLTDRQNAAYVALGGSGWLQGLLNLEIARQANDHQPHNNKEAL